MESFADLYGIVFNHARITSPQQVIAKTPSRGKRVVQVVAGASSLVDILAEQLGVLDDDPVQRVIARATAVCRQDWLVLHWPYAGTRNALLAPFNGSLLIGVPGENDQWYDRIALRTDNVSLLVDYAGAPALRMTAAVHQRGEIIARYAREGDVIEAPSAMPARLKEQLGLLLYLANGNVRKPAPQNSPALSRS